MGRWGKKIRGWCGVWIPSESESFSTLYWGTGACTALRISQAIQREAPMHPRACSHRPPLTSHCPRLRQGLDVILEMDRRLEALEGRGAAEGARPSSKVCGGVFVLWTDRISRIYLCSRSS